MKITYENDQDIVSIPDALYNTLVLVISKTLKHQNFNYDVEIGLTIVDDDKIRELNSIHRDINSATDVLSFPMFDFISPGIIDEEFLGDEQIILGDIVISAERALAQSIEYGHSFEREMAFLAVHSALHLIGYDHEVSSDDERVMFTLQDEILTECNIPRE